MSAPDRPTRAGGPWTRHGHDIPGTTVAGGRPPAVARCGGPALCRQCREDVAVAQGEKSAAPDRPTREQVEDAMQRAAIANLPWTLALAAEVRALRAELDGLRIGLDVETRRADDWQRVADGLAEDAARAAGVARTPQPAVAPGWCCTVGAQAYPGPCPGHGEQEPVGAPLPAVPDGEGARDLAEIRRLTETHPDAPRGELLAEVRRLVENDDHCTATHRTLDGEDVPARLDAAADALAAADLARGAAALRDAASVASIAGPDVRAAVAAALARPTGGRG